jgi:hypothetical protein
MNFKNFNILLQEQLARMIATGALFKSSVVGQDVWSTYMSNFTAAHNPVFRDPESSEHNCNCCHSLIKRYGNIVAIDSDYNVMTLFDVELEVGSTYYNSAKAVSERIRVAPVSDVFFETFDELHMMPYEGGINKTQAVFRLGNASNHKQYTQADVDAYDTDIVSVGQIIEFDHFHFDLPLAFVDISGHSQAALMGQYRSAKEVFNRAMLEIPLDTLTLVRDLIAQGSLLNGDAHLHKVEQMIPIKTEYNTLPAVARDNWSWVTSYGLPFAKFKNELIGVLCTDLAEGVELNKACQSWNKRVDPANYMKAVAPITENQKKAAREFVEEHGYLDSFDRRFAELADIDVNEIHHTNSGGDEIVTASIFDNVGTTKSTRHKKSQFENIEEVSIDKFMSDILPSCTSVEAFVENRFERNFVALTTANIVGSKPMFKWSNNFSRTYNGNLAGRSQLAEMVETRGGRVDGVFRFTHSWNKLERNESLMDLHVFMPGNRHRSDTSPHNTYGVGRRVGWNKRRDISSGGVQDVDYVRQAPKNYIPVENITFPSLSKMPDGDYICKIHNYNFRQSGGKGQAEIAFAGEIFQYEYPATTHLQWLTVAVVTLKDGVFSIVHHLPETNSSRSVWGIDTNRFRKVNLVCTSPNHWGENKTGNKDYLFMLDGCASDTALRSFHSEDFNSELTTHRKVLEPLGASNMLAPADIQLAGLGFNATVKDSVIVKCSGSFKRTLKINFL